MAWWILWSALTLVRQDPGDSIRANAPTAPLELALPSRSWGLTGTLPGVLLSSSRKTSSGVTLRGTDIDSGLVIRASLYPAPEPGGSLHCRDVLWKRERPPETRDVKKKELGPWAFVEYDTPSSRGAPIDKRDLLACRVHDGVWIQVEISLPTVEDEDRDSLRGPLAALTIGPVDPSRHLEAP